LSSVGPKQQRFRARDVIVVEGERMGFIPVIGKCPKLIPLPKLIQNRINLGINTTICKLLSLCAWKPINNDV
jgi:hypothetical protein